MESDKMLKIFNCQFTSAYFFKIVRMIIMTIFLQNFAIQMKINKNLEIAIEASIDAGKVVIEVYDTEFKVEIKGDKSPLTEADKRANDIINSFLIPTGIPIISEENKQIDYKIRKNWDTCWIVDPVDGTKEFVKRNGEFTVNIALVKQGKPILGVIYVPVSKVLYFANIESNEAYKITLESHSTPVEKILASAIPIEPNVNSSNPIKVVGSRSHLNQKTLDFLEALKEKANVEIISIGSSLKFCLVADGEADLYPRFSPTMEWDTAAGQAICNAVGVEVVSKDTNESLLYNKENLLNPNFLVSKKDSKS